MNVVRGKANEASIDNEVHPGGYMVVRESLKSKFPQTLVIKSANLRVLDPIGQGFSLYSSALYYRFCSMLIMYTSSAIRARGILSLVATQIIRGIAI